MYILLTLFFLSLIAIILMIGHKLALVRAGQTAEPEHLHAFVPDLEKIKQLVLQNIKENPNVDVIPCNDIIRKLLGECKEMGISERGVARRAGLTHAILGAYKRNEKHPSRNSLAKLIHAFKTANLDVSSLEQLGGADVFWDRITTIESQPYNGFVYDLTLNEPVAINKMPHNFVAQGIFVGNCMGTLHANTAREMMIRLTSEPMDVPESLLPLLDIAIVLARFYTHEQGVIRRVQQVAEVTRMADKVLLSNVFERDPAKDEVHRTDTPSHVLQVLSERTGRSKKEISKELLVRQRILEWMASRKMHDQLECEQVIQQYYLNPAELLERVSQDLQKVIE